jgi:hypothetical protein
MSSLGEEWKAEREWKLFDVILEEFALFESKYGTLTPDDEAWTVRMREWTRSMLAYVRGHPGVRRPNRPSSDGLHATTDEVRSFVSTPRPGLNEEEREEKRWRWRRMWARVEGLIVGFDNQQRDAAGDDRAWALRVAADARHGVAMELQRLKVEHPDMPPVDDLSADEILRALLFDEEDESELALEKIAEGQLPS